MSNYKILKEYEQNLMHLHDVLGNSSTNNIELNKICLYLFGDAFKGVYSSNDMPSLKNNEMCIINTDDGKGEHWIACYKYKDKTYCYDSFDRDIKTLSKYWKNNNWINANTDRDQSFNEFNCGQKSIAWLISAHKYMPNKIMKIV